MRDKLITARNYIMQKKYKWILKPIFFKIDPEVIHDYMVSIGKYIGKYSPTRAITNFFWGYSHPALQQKILGIDFKNPVGLAAGFDKNANLINIIPSVGFGFTEIGSITGEPCSGNPKPRLWRLPKSQSLSVYYGLVNDGCEAISKRLGRQIKKKKFPIPVGISIAKTNCKETAETETAIADYLKAYRAFKNIGDYITINVSCPNAFGGQPFTDSARLEKLLSKITSIPKIKPIFLKISPDLGEKEIDDIIKLALKFKIDGFICTNLTKNHNNIKIIDKIVPELGGLSGKAVEDLSLNLIRYVYKKINNSVEAKLQQKPIIIGVGGIFSAEDAYSKIKAGATLVQLITGMIFEGPQLISDINLGLVKLLQRDGYRNISEAIGKE